MAAAANSNNEKQTSDQVGNNLIEAENEQKPVFITIDFSKDDNMTQQQKTRLYNILPQEKRSAINNKQKIRIEVFVAEFGEDSELSIFHLSSDEFGQNTMFSIPTKSIESTFINPDDTTITEEGRGPDSDGEGGDYGGGKWSLKYKRSINCNRPKGFSQRQYCKYSRKKKRGRKSLKRKKRGRKTRRKRKGGHHGFDLIGGKKSKRKGGHHGFDLIGGKKSKINKTERIVKFKRGPGKSKYTAIVQHKKTKKKRSINFGHKDYPQFKDSTPLGYYSYKNHGTKKRKDAYYSRHSGTKLKAKAIRKEFRKSGGKYTPKLLSHIYLW